MNNNNILILFQEKHIRRQWHEGEWWFSIIDIIEALTESSNPAVYWRVLKKRLLEEGGNETVTKCNGLKMSATDGKMRLTDCATTETLLRLIQSIPSTKAEPFKRWLAQVGYERIQEIENPELAAQRSRQYYKDLGYSDEWIERRMQSIEIREQLTEEWKQRGVKEEQEYAILTAEISKATFGLKPSEYMKLNGLKQENLRDHMTNLELIFTMLGEEQTKQEAIKRDALGFPENKEATVEGGQAAGDACNAFEKRTGAKVVTNKNFKKQIAEAKQEKKLPRKDNLE
jgi:hypothetical protein